jgi:hypothetical protein
LISTTASHRPAVIERQDRVDVGLEAHVPLLHHALGHAQKPADVPQHPRELTT